MNDWLTFVIDAIGGACAFICLFEGTRRLGAYGRQRTAVVMTALGAAYCVLYGGFFLVKHYQLSDYAQTLYQQASHGELPADWGKQLPAARREAGSRALARSAYVESGTLRTYFDAAGERKQFAPAQADVKRRDAIVANRARLEESMRESFANGLLWLIWGVLATLFGYGVSREKTAPAS